MYLYTDYLLSSFGQITGTGFFRLVDSALSHDSISRFLSGNNFTSKILWEKVKSLVREYETDDACLIFDDIIVEKPYTDKNTMISWHFDHSKSRTVKGINMPNAFYHKKILYDAPLRLPVSFEIILKTLKFCVIKTKKENRHTYLVVVEYLYSQFVFVTASMYIHYDDSPRSLLWAK